MERYVTSNAVVKSTANTVIQPYVTEMDLRHSLIPDDLVEEMVKTMPEHSGADGQEDGNLRKYDYMTFMEKLMGSKSNGRVNGQ
jgi:hypothetical protein